MKERATPLSAMHDEIRSRKSIASWLLVCCALVFAMVVLGGATRLTHSGLSIVEWQPIVGAVPPLNAAQWEEAFAKYRATPEYAQVNAGMTLDQFKGIFWIEYFHRLLGRLIGLVFLVPFLYFLARRRIAGVLAWKLGAIFLLGGLQGVVGWYMVKSGLVDDPRVSQYRLALHLALAFVIYGAMLWTALGLREDARGVTSTGGADGLRRLSLAITITVALMVITGAFVAGIRAGLAYNTFPLMNGHVVPPGILMLEPWWKNFTSNMATVQFDHRAFAWLLAVLVIALWIKAIRAVTPRRVRVLAHALVVAVALQVSLGISTLLFAVPVALGVAHQGGALVVFTIAVALNHSLKRSTNRRNVRTAAGQDGRLPGRKRCDQIACACLSLMAMGWCGFASAQAYPNRPIRLVVPFVPGGTIDAYARVLARQVESQLGQPIVIDNRAGANGILGADVVAKAAPDGYTLLNNAASFVINASMYKKLPYDTEKDFTPITNFVRGLGYVLVAHPSVPASSVKELIALAKKKAGSVRFSSPGIGNGQHLAAELFNMKTGIELLHVPYKGSAPALAAVLGGEVQVAFQTPNSVIPLVSAGKLKALAFSGERRLDALASVPTVAEAGVPGYAYDVAWHAWFAPAKLPATLADRLHSEIRKALQEPKLVAFFREGGFEPQADPPAEFAKIFRADIRRYAEIVRAAKIEPE